MPQDKSSAAELPAALREQLEQFRRQLWRTKIAEAIFAGIFGLLLSYLLVFGLDRIWPTPAIVRLAILLGGTSLAAVFAPIWLHRWVWGHRREQQLARLISRKHPGLGDRLLGVIELQGQLENSDSLSPRLRAAAMEAVAAETARRKLDDSLPVSRHRRWSLAVVCLFLIAACALTLVPKAGLNSLKRWLMPLSSTERYTFTVLESTPNALPVPVGEAFSITVRLDEESEWQPAVATARYSSQDPISTNLADRDYRFDFPGQQEEGDVRIEVGDARRVIRVIPSVRPTQERSLATITFPDYLQLKPETAELPTGTVNAVQGSTVSLSIDVNRSLETASFGPVTELLPADASVPESAVPESKVVDMKVRASSASTSDIPVGENSLEVPMQWVDTIGLAGAGGFKIRIEAVPDEAPTCYIEGTPSQQAILASETVDLEVTATDDFGIRQYGLEWQGEPTRAGGGEVAKGELILEKGAPDMTRASQPAAFSPKAYDIGPQKLFVRAYVEDYLPERGRSYSQPIMIYVLSTEEHAQMLKNQFDRTIGELEDLTRKERTLFEENQRLERLDGSELQDEKNQERLADQEEAERQQAEKMKELAEQMEELLQDSARNGSIDKETMQKMAEAMKSMSEMGEQEMPEVEEKLGEAGDQKNTEEKSEKDMKEAVEKQKELLEKMEETIEKANDANQQFEASTFISRLKKAASDEDGVVTAAIDGSDTFGLRRPQMDPADLGVLDGIVRQQSDTTSDVRWIQEDLGHFFTRTSKEIYGEILGEMVESQIDIGLEDVRMLLTDNKSFGAAQSASEWADKLREWAEKLEGADDDDGDDGGSGSGSGGADEDFEFMLRVMRMVQQEQDLRARTRALETLRRSYELENQP